jgi:hypothetical protein
VDDEEVRGRISRDNEGGVVGVRDAFVRLNAGRYEMRSAEK